MLNSGLEQMGLTISDSAKQQLNNYIELLAKWSKVYNLTTVREPHQIVTQHILDSLSVLPFLKDSANLLDVGTGAGLPGIPLAIVCPEISVKLLDSQQKKINFVQHVITSLKLSNALAIHGRVESLPVDFRFDTIISRAFASLDEFVRLIASLCDIKTKIIAMKGRRERVVEESLALGANFEIVRIESLSVPGLNAERCLVFLTKKGD